MWKEIIDGKIVAHCGKNAGEKPIDEEKKSGKKSDKKIKEAAGSASQSIEEVENGD
jgi:hypothetical protein